MTGQRHCADSLPDHSRFHESLTGRRLLAIVRAVDRDNAYIGILSTREQCAVALVLDRPDIAKEGYGSLLECKIRVGPERPAAAAFVQANGWTETAEVLA